MSVILSVDYGVFSHTENQYAPYIDHMGPDGSVTTRTEHVPAERTTIVVSATTSATETAIIRLLLEWRNVFLLLRDDFLYFHSGLNSFTGTFSGITNSGHAAFIGSIYGLLPTIQNREFSFNNSGLCSWIHVMTLPS